MGVGHFHIADMDHFELPNFNRQVGATVSSLDRSKVDTMESMVLDINPSCELRGFSNGLTVDNVDEFLTGVDVVLDGLDYFAVDARKLMYKKTYERNIPVVAAGPIGCSAALLVFLPGKMTWHDYFAMDLAKTSIEQYVLFAIGTAPRATQMRYLDRRYVSLKDKIGPSLSLAVELCAGVAAAETLKILLKRGTVYPAPYYQQFDAYRCTLARGKLRWGNRGPIQRLKFRLFRKMLRA
jgi:molybdopterin/thiamine biosynthesis adenylyltransferase